jgi:PAS domain S-box-containing protein
MEGNIHDVNKELARLREQVKTLSRTNNDLLLLFENTDQVFFSVDLKEEQLIQISQSCERILGYTQEEIHQNPRLLLEMVLEEDRLQLNQDQTNILQGCSFKGQLRILTKNGDIRWVDTRISSTSDIWGEVTRIDAILSDITERKKIENDLIDSEEHNRNLFNQSTIGLVLADMNGTLIKVNEAYTRIIGYTPEEAKQITYWEITPPEYLEIENEKLKEINATGKYSPYEKEYIRKDKRRVPVRMSGNVIEKNGVRFILSSVEDITESKKAQASMLLKNEELQKTNHELDKFVYSVSHDLRAPLTSMLGVINLAKDDTGDATMLEHLNMLEGGIKKLDGFILDILDYSRNSRSALRKDDVYFEELVDDITHNLKFMSTSSTHPVKIETAIEGRDVFISDKSRISIILNNLVSNALRYHNPATREPYVRVKVCYDDQAAVIIVEDNGIGIPKDLQHRVFEMFYRVSDNSVGSGLGLYIVRETVEKLNGLITLESEPGKGSTFRIQIPNSLKKIAHAAG